MLKFSRILLIFNTHVHAVCSLHAGIKRGIPIRYRYSCIAPTYIRIVCTLSLLEMPATNQYDEGNWFMHTRVSVYVRSFSNIAMLHT